MAAASDLPSPGRKEFSKAINIMELSGISPESKKTYLNNKKSIIRLEG